MRDVYAGILMAAVFLAVFLLVMYYRHRSEVEHAQAVLSATLTPDQEAEFQRQLGILIESVKGASLAQYEQGYEDGQEGVPASEPEPPANANLSDPLQAQLNRSLRFAYRAGYLDAQAGKPNRVRVWRDEGGTVDGPLPKLRDRTEKP